MLSLNKRAASFLILSAMLTSSVSCASSVGKADSSEELTQAAEVSTEAGTETAQEVTAEAVTEQATEAKNANAGSKGNIYDVKGRLLVSTGTDSAGKPVRVYSDDYAVSLANIITEMSDGYDTAFNDLLSEPQEGTDVGQSIQLTIDADVQNAVYDYMQSSNLVGSVVAMRTDGSILAQVSYPSYDPRTVSDQKYDEELAWGKCGNKAFQNFEPGSCFKIMSEVIADKHGFYSCHDEGEWKFDGISIVNWDHDTGSYPVERSLQSAFVNSSNIFFAKAFDSIGSEAVLSDLDSIFHFKTPIDCDFGEIKNNVEIYCEDDLRRTAFGQSYVLTCPIYLAALGREAAFGNMVKPFVLKDVVDTNDSTKVLKQGSTPGEVIASIPQEYRQNLQNGMSGVAGGLGVYVPQGYSLYAKTGTAETWENDFLYITGCVKNNSDDGTASYGDYSNYDGSYVIVMQVRNPADHGFEFASHSASLYQGVVNAVVGK
ncbi:MAG: peptidoglycan glycosyltransferase [Ruminococcus sp.]|nr:peptidoglycan glycosyltransferase [Ruminococcus sp.]